MNPLLRNVVLEYESVLLNQKLIVSKYFFKYDSYANEKLALGVIRYSIKTYLKWSPHQVEADLTNSILKLLKLDAFISYIEIPPELIRTYRMKYLACLLYPEHIHYNKKVVILQTYKDILNRKIKRFPKNYLTGVNGILHTCTCFLYMLEQYLSFSSIEELYKHFASPKGFNTLRKYHLLAICTEFYESPLLFLHTALPDTQKNEFFFQYYKYKNILGKSVPNVIPVKQKAEEINTSNHKTNISVFFFYYRLYRNKVRSSCLSL